jgi:GAF domain-containing protein
MEARGANVESVLITPRLAQRPPRRPDDAGESRAFSELRNAAPSAQQALQKIADVALHLCEAGSAGISLVHPPLGDGYLSWRAVAGEFAPHTGVVTPRNFSTCGTALELAAPQLFHYPGRVFTYLNGLGAPVMELLVVPIQAGERALGTLWVAGHDASDARPQAERRFDSGDLRIVAGLAAFAATALQRLAALAGPGAAGSRQDTEPLLGALLDPAHRPLRLPWWRRLSPDERH